MRRLRYALGLSQPELAARAQRVGWDVGRDVIAKIAGQLRWVSDAEIVGLAKALGVPVSRLLPKTEEALNFLQKSTAKRRA